VSLCYAHGLAPVVAAGDHAMTRSVCGRFTLTILEPEEIARLLGVDPSPQFLAHHRPRYNVAPTDEHWVVRLGQSAAGARRELVPATWGFGQGKRINTRAENARARTMLRDPAAGHRCLVPADGFFEWMGEKGDRRPLWFHRRDGGLILFAATCSEGASGFQFSILTTEPNALVAPVHDRMPVVLSVADADRWLTATDPVEIAALLRPPPDDALIATEVSKRVNVVGNDDPACLAPPETTPSPPTSKPTKQMRLF
jgi:putative SOS response-associated peptidase YedK